MEALLTYGFIQRALLAGIFIAVACAVLGLFLVLRRDAMIGHGLAHVTFAGVALGLFLNIMPILMALAVAVLTALGIMKLKEKAGLYGDTAIGIFSSAGMALGILLVTLSHRFNVDLFSYLFGEILAIEPLEVWLSICLTLIIIGLVAVYYHKFLYMTFDRESAKASGVKVGKLDGLLTILTAVTIVLGMKVVGILLVAALLVIPAAAGLQLARSFKTALVFSSAISLLSVSGGLFIAFTFDWPASGSIVLFSFVLFGFSFIFKKKR